MQTYSGGGPNCNHFATYSIIVRTDLYKLWHLA